MNQAAPSTRKLMKAAENALAKGKGDEALPLFQQVLALNPAHPEALYRVGYIMHSAGQYPTAINYYEQAIRHEPRHAASYTMMAYALDMQKRGQEAMRMAQLGTQMVPENPDIHIALVGMMLRYQQTHLAVPYLETVMPQFPKNAEMREFYCMALKTNDRLDEAKAAYADLQKNFRMSPAFQVNFETYIPRLAHSVAQIEQVRRDFADGLERLIAAKPRVLYSMLTSSVFFLAFHNRDNKALLKRYTDMLRIVVPELNYTAPSVKNPPARDAAAPIRVAFISAHMHKHSVGDCYRGAMLYLAALPEFAVTLFSVNNVQDAKTQEIIEGGVPIVHLARNIDSLRAQIEQFRPDIVIYPDIGMDITTHCIAMGRLARYQCCFQGHPETTGIDTIDYVISSRTYEPPDAQQNYGETLLCNAGIDTVFKRAATPKHWLSREELGLPLDRKLYVCPMAIQKFHPDFDEALAAILARDPQATLVLFNDFDQQISTRILTERILAKCDKDRVIFLNWQPLDRLFSILKACDAMLDTFYFGAGTTAQYAFTFGIPIVTMPGRWARGRVVHSYYAIMGIEQAPEASNPAEYIELAYRLANDGTYKEMLSQQILGKNERMFEQGEYGPHLAQLLKDVMAQRLEPYRC